MNMSAAGWITQLTSNLSGDLGMTLIHGFESKYIFIYSSTSFVRLTVWSYASRTWFANDCTVIMEESDDSPPVLRASWAIIGACEDIPLCARRHTHAHPSDAKNIMVTDLKHLQSLISVWLKWVPPRPSLLTYVLVLIHRRYSKARRI